MKDVEVSSSRINTVSLSTRNVKNVELALWQCEKERDELRKYKHRDINKELLETVEHQRVLIENHRLFCGQRNTEVMFTGCKARRSRKECHRICSEAKRFMGI